MNLTQRSKAQRCRELEYNAFFLMPILCALCRLQLCVNPIHIQPPMHKLLARHPASHRSPAVIRADDAKPLKVLMVTGGCCHDYEHQKMHPGRGHQRAGQCGIHHRARGGPGREERQDAQDFSIYEKPDWAKGYDVILHNECFGGVEDVAFVERIAKAHFEGVPAVMLHCSTHSYRMAGTDEWRKCVGQKSMSHEKNRDLHVMNLKPEHPVMIGFPMEWLDKADELYKNELLYEHFVPLAKAYGEDTKKDHNLIWVNNYGEARVFGTTMGHEKCHHERSGLSRSGDPRPALGLPEAG